MLKSRFCRRGEKMAKVSEYKLVWIKCDIGVKWEIETGWEVVEIVGYEQGGRMLCLVRGIEK
jgi:hypothetical protein